LFVSLPVGSFREIAVYRAGVSPLHPTKGTFEKVPLESLKLFIMIIYQYFLKVLEGGLGGASQCLLKANLHRATRGGF
jgi:hypothetical protein